MTYQPINGWTKDKIIARIQEVFGEDKTRCVDEDGECVYRGSGNGQADRCAVGAFIPDGHPSLGEWNNYQTSPSDMDGDLSWMPLEPRPLAHLQRVHDLAEDGPVGPVLVKWIEENVMD